LIFDSFCYEPENIYEKRVGSLYIVGLLKNALSKHKKLLDNLALVIKREYYRLTRIAPEKALKESLKEANNFLEEIAKKGDVSWLGNLSFLVIGLKGLKWNFSKIGEIKIFLLRGGKVVDIEKKVRLKEIEPYPLRVFGSKVSGKLVEGDAILILTKEVFELFEKEDLFKDLAKIGRFDGKSLKEIFENKKEEVLKISGICLVISLIKEVSPKKRELILPKISPIEIKFKEVFSPILNPVMRFLYYWVNLFKKIKPPVRKVSIPVKLPPVKLPKLKLPELKFPKLKLRKEVIPVLALIFVLFFGYLFVQIEERKKLKNYERVLAQVQEKFDQAESFLILKDPRLTQDANNLLQESLEEILPLVKVLKKLPDDLKNKVFTLNEEISKKLFELNKLEEIELELVFEFNPREFVPQKMVTDGENLYFFSPYANDIFKLDKENEEKILSFEKKLSFARNFNSEVLFFSTLDQLIILKDDDFSQFLLKTPYPDFEVNDFSIFRKNLYFLDKKAGRIIKYEWLSDFRWEEPEIWMENEKLIGAKSIAIDGSIWVLKPNNKILRCYAGQIQEELDFDIFPEKKDFSKIHIFSPLPYIFVLEPAQERVIILEKSGQIFKQFQSEEFDNLLDFSVSKDGKTIWLLNSLKLLKFTL